MDNTKQFQNEVAQYVLASQDLVEKQAAENKTLLSKVASLSAENSAFRVQKEASQQSAPAMGMAPETVAALADTVIRAGFLKEASREQFVGAALNNPNGLASFITGLANVTIQHTGLPILGQGVEKEASVTAEKGRRASDIAFEASMSKLSQKQ